MMKKTLPIKYLVLADLALAAGMTAYWFTAGISQMQLLGIFVSIFLAGCPLPYFLSSFLVIQRAAKSAEQKKIQLRSPEVLDRLQYIDTLALNKNGIITAGKPYISDIVPEGMSQSALLTLAASAERDAVHPIGQAIFKTAVGRNLRLQRLAACSEIPGCGVEAIISGKPVRVGRLNWLKGEKVDISASLLTKNDKLAYRGKIPVFVSNGKYARGIIALEDEIPQDITASIHLLQKFGLHLIMLTGDSPRTATAIKKATGIDEVRADLTPQDKVREIKLLRARGSSIAMVGDPESDRAILAEADLSIKAVPQKNARLSRSRVEVIDEEEEEKDLIDDVELLDAPVKEQEPSSEEPQKTEPPAFQPDIVLHEGLRALAPAIELARTAHSLMRQNRILAYAVWLFLLPPAMGLLAAFGGPFLIPDIALGGLCAASACIFLNSLRMR